MNDRGLTCLSCKFVYVTFFPSVWIITLAFVSTQELSLLPLMEPSITAGLDLFTPFGGGPANVKAQLKGSFGNAVLDNIPDYYSQLLTKVTNTSVSFREVSVRVHLWDHGQGIAVC